MNNIGYTRITLKGYRHNETATEDSMIIERFKTNVLDEMKYIDANSIKVVEETFQRNSIFQRNGKFLYPVIFVQFDLLFNDNEFIDDMYILLEQMKMFDYYMTNDEINIITKRYLNNLKQLSI